MRRSARLGILSVGAATLAAHVACGRNVAPVLRLDDGVSWALAQVRARTLSDLHYTYRVRVPRALGTPLEGTLVADFDWSGTAVNDLVLDFKDPAARIGDVRGSTAPPSSGRRRTTTSSSRPRH